MEMINQNKIKKKNMMNKRRIVNLWRDWDKSFHNFHISFNQAKNNVLLDRLIFKIWT